MLIDHSDILQGLEDVYFLVLLAVGVLWIPLSALAAAVADRLNARMPRPLSLLLAGYWCSLTSMLAATVRLETFETNRSLGPVILVAAAVLSALFLRAHFRTPKHPRLDGQAL